MADAARGRDWTVDVGLLAMRVLFGGAMLWLHGAGKFGALMSGQNPWAARVEGFIGLGGGVEFVLAALAESVLALFLIFGLGTRAVAMPLVITMLVAGFLAHGADPMPAERVVISAQHITEEGREAIRHQARGKGGKPNATATKMAAAIDAMESAQTESDKKTATKKATFKLRSGSPELAYVYLFGFLALLIMGPGRFSADHHIKRLWRKRRKDASESP